MGSIGLPELLIVLGILIVVLGPKRLPRSARALGTGVRNFKKSIRSEDEPATAAELPKRTTDDEPETVDGEVVRDPSRR